MKKWTERGTVRLEALPLCVFERPLLVTVMSDAEGKSLAIKDPSNGVTYTLDGDLIAYWFEHGTEAK